jgi:hypothetical protein
VVTVDARGKPLWADVLLDGKKVGASDLTFPAPAGRHRLTVRRAGYREVSVELRLRPGKTVVRKITLLPRQ